MALINKWGRWEVSTDRSETEEHAAAQKVERALWWGEADRKQHGHKMKETMKQRD